MKPVAFFILTMLSLASASAQVISAARIESWEERPKVNKLASQHESESAVILSDDRRIEFVQSLRGEMMAYKTLHKRIHINDDKGIESFNKVYLPVSKSEDIVQMKARTILASGKIIEVDKRNIKDLEEDGNLYKIFALEGMEKGCEVEYYYTYKRDGSYFGRELFQTRVPVLSSSFCLITPEKFVFESKVFNSRTKVVDTVANSRRETNIRFGELDGAEDEQYSNMTAQLARVEYKLSYNKNAAKQDRIFTWNELATRITEIYGALADKEMKRVRNLIDDERWDRLQSDKERITAVENFIKKNFSVRDGLEGEDADNVERILKTKLASNRGIIRLFSGIYSRLGVEHQFVLAGDRNDFVVDTTFENWSTCENTLFFFPSTGKFLAPTSVAYRYPWFPPQWGDASGVYCKTGATVIGQIKNIPLEPFQQSSNDLDITVQLTPDLNAALVDVKQAYSGYAGGMYRGYFNFASEEERKSYVKQFVKFGTKSENILSSRIDNMEFEGATENKPFLISASVKASELVESAGNKVLVKIGEVIGTQIEMYQDKKRKFPMEIDFPHSLTRKIRFTIPEGYKVKNLSELSMSAIHSEASQPVVSFISSYKQNGQVVDITVAEEYRKTRYPLDSYQEFRKVVNAAADFNKIVLVLEKS